MKQHNHWKLNNWYKKFYTYLLWGFGIALLILNNVFKSIDFDLISNLVGAISLVAGGILLLIEKVLWKTKIMNLPFLENYWTPIIEGRWVGYLTRDNQQHEFVIEIKQSFTSISCITYSNHSSSSAITTEILYNDQLKNYQLVYYWRGKTTTVQKGTGDRNEFNGFTALNIQIQNNKAIKLTGDYFTDRQPKQTRGTINLKFQQKELKNSF